MTERDPHARQPVLQTGAEPVEADAGVILVHGRGASAESILTLAAELDRQRVTFVAPQAASVGYGPAWYPNSFLAPLAANEPWLTSALAAVHRARLALEEAGLPTSRIVLAGFSQGACLASEYAARNAELFGGIVALSGGLIGSEQIPGVDPPADKRFDYESSLKGTPVFIGCSDRDPHIPVDRVHTTAEVMNELGGTVDLRIYEGMGHTVNADELEAFGQILDAVLTTA